MELKPIKLLASNFISIENLYSFIVINQKFFESQGILFEKRDINEGDFYYSEHGCEYQINIFDDVFNIGYCYITEDSEDWAQAESYRSNWIEKVGKKQGSLETAHELYNLLMDYKSIKREKLLTDILK